MLDKFERIAACPVCSSSSLSPYRTGTFDMSRFNQDHIKITDSDYGKIWDLSRCDRCTHIFANPCPTPEFLQSLYGDVEDPLYEEEARGRSKNFKRILAALDQIHPQQGRLFDVGAATGILLAISRERGWEAAGIEPSAWAVRTARDKYDLTILEGPFEAAHLPENHYTVVTMVDFIEHIPRPLDAASTAQKILAPGGTLCLVTPDINSLAARIMREKWWHYRVGHLGYFSKTSLGTLLHRAGLRLIKARKYSWTFSLHYLISRKAGLKFLLKNPVLASLWKKIPIKLALQDSFEVYATKNKAG